jgi:protein TonB
MEKKSYHNLEKTRFSNLMTGFCFVSGIVLAAFSYGKNKEIEKKYRSSIDNSQFYIELKEPPKEVVQPQSKPEPIQSQQKETHIDLNSDLSQVSNTDVETNNTTVDLGLTKGDTTVIVNNNLDIPVVTPTIENYPDVEAEFPGGYDAWKKYLLSELRYPSIALELGEQGVVYIEFVIELDGSISNVRVIKGVSLDIDREAKRVIKNSPKWVPGRTANNQVRTRLNIPIRFEIN